MINSYSDSNDSWSCWTPNSRHLTCFVFHGLFHTSGDHDLIYNNTWFPPMPWQGETPSSDPTDLAIVSRHIPVSGLRTCKELRKHIHERRLVATISITEKRKRYYCATGKLLPAVGCTLQDNQICLSHDHGFQHAFVRTSEIYIVRSQKIPGEKEQYHWASLKSSEKGLFFLTFVDIN